MTFANRAVAAVLTSPLHRLLSSSTALVRYTGRRSGLTYRTPTQYAEHNDELVILVGGPDEKSWWRNFREDRDIDVLVRGTWLAMTAQAVVGADDPDTIAPLLKIYGERFPKAGRSLPGETDERKAQHAVVVWCRPR